MQFTATQIAQLLQGTVEGDANASVTKLSKIEEGGAGSLSFLANPAYTQYVYDTTASVVIIGKDHALTAPVKTTLVRVADAQGAFAKVLEMYNTIKLDKKGISPQAAISESATHGRGLLRWCAGLHRRERDPGQQREDLPAVLSGRQRDDR